MKRSKFIKILLSTALIVSSIVLFSLGALADTVRVSYSYGDSVYSEFVEADKAFTLHTPVIAEGDTFFGWVDANGNLYPKNTSATLSEDTTLYLVSGKEVSNQSELLSAVAEGKTYIKLSRSLCKYGKSSFVGLKVNAVDAGNKSNGITKR